VPRLFARTGNRSECDSRRLRRPAGGSAVSGMTTAPSWWLRSMPFAMMRLLSAIMNLTGGRQAVRRHCGVDRAGARSEHQNAGHGAAELVPAAALDREGMRGVRIVIVGLTTRTFLSGSGLPCWRDHVRTVPRYPAPRAAGRQGAPAADSCISGTPSVAGGRR